MSLWAVIMAGGSGRRFWPVSRETRPKQFLKLNGEETLIEQCLKRILRVVPIDHVVIVSSMKHREMLNEVLPTFPEDRILFEPVGRNTAPCIAWANAYIRSLDPEALVGVFPSDHYISDEEKFASSLKGAFERAQENRIVLFGIEPDRPETGYGYIELGDPLPAASDGPEAFLVRRFAEKPDLETAREYLESHRYVWNSGMFIFSAALMDAEIRRYLPALAKGIEEIMAHPQALPALFPELPSISIDYGVMERTESASVMRAAFPWSDVGAWNAVSTFYPKDADGNAVRGDAVMSGCRDVFVFSQDKRLVSVLGLENVIVVSTNDALLVTTPSESQNVRKIVKILEDMHREDLL